MSLAGGGWTSCAGATEPCLCRRQLHALRPVELARALGWPARAAHGAPPQGSHRPPTTRPARPAARFELVVALSAVELVAVVVPARAARDAPPRGSHRFPATPARLAARRAGIFSPSVSAAALHLTGGSTRAAGGTIVAIACAFYRRRCRAGAGGRSGSVRASFSRSFVVAMFRPCHQSLP